MTLVSTCIAAALVVGVSVTAAIALRRLRAVQASRQRIVGDWNVERRRLEQDLHNGAQQQLVVLGLELRLLQERCSASDPEISELAAQAGARQSEIYASIRELSLGLHPIVLGTSGLGLALTQLAEKTPYTVQLSVGFGSERFPADFEATAYQVVCAALSEVGGQRPAPGVDIRAERRGQVLVVEVRDHDPGACELASVADRLALQDRVTALGGRLTGTTRPTGRFELGLELPVG